MKTVRTLLLGDVVGTPGRMMFQKHIEKIKQDFKINVIIVNGENSAGGRGITPRIAKFFKNNGVNVITTGNHIWHNREIYSYLDEHTDVLRPENFPNTCPGSGVTTFAIQDVTIGVINLQGRVFMREHVDCPFRIADSVLTYLRSKTSIIFVDFHAETTSEKMGLAYYLDGRVSALVGTHTHVQTADERILQNGTAFITDLGMCGALNSMLGMKKEPIIENFLTQMPQKFVVEHIGPMIMCGVIIDVETSTGKATKIERIKIIDHEISVESDHD